MTDAVKPRSTYGIWECKVDESTVNFAGLSIKSVDLARHMAGAKYIALMAVTLGVQADALIRQYSVTAMDKAVVADAECSVLVERTCDKVAAEIASKPEVAELQPTTRFSPGYGDFDIASQKSLLALLNAQKRIGLTLTDGYMLSPSKSVTALIGYV